MADQYFNLRPGQTLGRHYFIVECLGGGWEGEVFKVEERRTGILRAAKLFFPKREAKGMRLLRYARKLHKLRACPLIIQYHHRDVARVGRDQVEFLVSDLVEGVKLSTYLDAYPGKRLPSFEALHLLHAITIGVEHIHYLGEYHGDIHSDNIMLKRRGLGYDVSLLDFYELGGSSRSRIQQDVYDLIGLLYEMLGGAAVYQQLSSEIKQLICGRKHSLLRKKFKNAGHLRLALENLHWD